MLSVTEIFRSIQGESTFAGLPCTFVRLSGCNLRCSYCDTTYAYESGEQLSIDQILDRVTSLGSDLVEVTGGEPLLQTDTPALLNRLSPVCSCVLLETNGSLPLPSTRQYRVVMDVKCPSSGESSKVCWNNLSTLQTEDEIKFVIADRTDFDWATDVVRDKLITCDRQTTVLFAPVADALAPRDLAAWILDTNLPVRLQLQLHRVIWPEQTRGV